jgi:hypothetical protein
VTDDEQFVAAIRDDIVQAGTAYWAWHRREMAAIHEERSARAERRGNAWARILTIADCDHDGARALNANHGGGDLSVTCGKCGATWRPA